MVSNFKEKLRTCREDKQPDTMEYEQEVGDPFPFSDQPSGSKWGRPHVDWLHIIHECNCDLKRMFTQKSKLEDSGSVVRFLQHELDLSWEQVTDGDHEFEFGSVYDRLRALASWVKPIPVHIPDLLPSSSSPARSQWSDTSTIIYRTHGISAGDVVAARPTSDITPSGSPKSRSAPSTPEATLRRSTRHSEQTAPNNFDSSSQCSDTLSELSSSGEDSEYQPLPSSPPAAPIDAIDGLSPEERLEKEVEFAAMAFLYLMAEAFKTTGANLTALEMKKQDLVFGLTAPRGLEIKVDGLVMKSHPDLAIDLFANDTKAQLVVEVKSPNHHLSEIRLLGQQVSELLGSAMLSRRVYKQEYYTTYLISWHFLECYISRMEVSDKYLSVLEKDSSKMIGCVPPVVRRSQVFDMMKEDQRIQFSKAAARIGIELLYQYPTHRGNGTGLVKRLRGVTPFKQTGQGDDVAIYSRN